jgi:hypothetical protein
MTQIVDMKKNLLSAFHQGLNGPVSKIAATRGTRKEKASEVNSLAGAIKTNLSKNVHTLPKNEWSSYVLTLQYCFSVASLEYRHKVWPYEYMAFSRRVGELWEAFCRAAWDYPSRPSVARIPTPNFASVREVLFGRIKANIGAHGKREEIIKDVNTLFETIGDINMKEDEVFVVDGTPHVIDFKSGFGSNEKGNMLRLQTVGNAYRIWNHQTRLLLLVRQEENNNYLRVLRRLGLWEVHTGAQAYDEISQLTGADMQKIRNSIIDWKSDLSTRLYSYLKNQPTDLTSYLTW